MHSPTSNLGHLAVLPRKGQDLSMREQDLTLTPVTVQASAKASAGAGSVCTRFLDPFLAQASYLRQVDDSGHSGLHPQGAQSTVPAHGLLALIGSRNALVSFIGSRAAPEHVPACVPYRSTVSPRSGRSGTGATSGRSAMLEMLSFIGSRNVKTTEQEQELEMVGSRNAPAREAQLQELTEGPPCLPSACGGDANLTPLTHAGTVDSRTCTVDSSTELDLIGVNNHLDRLAPENSKGGFHDQ